MSPNPGPVVTEFVLVISNARGRFADVLRAMWPLSSDGAPEISRVDAYFDVNANAVILRIRCVEGALSQGGLAWVAEVVRESGIELIEWSQVAEEQQDQMRERMASCQHFVENLPELGIALWNLSRTLGPEAWSEIADDPTAAKVAFSAQPAVRTVAISGGDAWSEKESSQLANRPSLKAPRIEQPTIDARYLRSGRWAPVRLRALSIKGAYLITSALPRLGDQVHIALGLGELSALVRGDVFHVTSHEDIATTGTSGFAVRFNLDDPARRQLTLLLSKARDNGVSIKVPPSRRSVRLPVSWPVSLTTSRGPVRGDALDISRSGMFVHPERALQCGVALSFSAPLDDGTSNIEGRARVVRQISDAEASKRGLRPGFGLCFEEISDDDNARWLAFLDRVQKRSERRILVGATPERLTELSTALTSIGYLVAGGTNPEALIQLSDAEPRPPDVALIDATFMDADAPTNWLESVFFARKIPCVTHRGEASRARTTVDRMLSVIGA
jgi:hypothetical protein